ncbi:PilZ domain-containing protein [Spartinivicinus poritis]|uniref:PilZ domain-containing protein n=1 Tax=Spartinivicinus poritis TaxID=2994640 RepID=A0ABT5UA93_9GAMM|nr:PilZ domain-containing protein [Spartinivicinus sp. A2-2]MDE1462916.1 PilZ domain-containing protein [Spartinivicinus sp. A2-2]
MSDEKRRHQRTKVTLQIKLMSNGDEGITLKTRDISDSGIFLLAEEDSIPPLGTIVKVQVQGLPIPAPVCTMEVVRQEPEGFGLRMLDK